MTDDDLTDAIDSIDGSNADSITQYDDGTGHFTVDHKADADELFGPIEDALNEAGYAYDGDLALPGITQINFKPQDGDQDD